MTEAARTRRIETELDALKDQANVERISLPWKDQLGQTFPVVNLSVDAVVLNHSSHRIKAQLASHPARKKVEDDPFSEASQEIISDLLRRTEGYADLEANLHEVGQHEPGVVTRRGVLINANTRLVALRDLRKDYIRVAVLPESADSGDLARLELALQMRRDFKQEYTFTNQLLFVEDLRTTYGYDDDKVAKAMNLAASSDPTELKRGAKQAAAFTRMLAIIRDLQTRSRNRIPYGFFDDKRQALIDLDQAYDEQKNRDPEGAGRMREARLLAILTGAFYRDIRLIDKDSVVAQVVSAIGDNPEVGGELIAVIQNGSAPPNGFKGVRDLADEPDPGATTSSVAPLVDLVASSFGSGDVLLPSVSGDRPRKLESDELMRHVAESLGDAVEQIKDQAREAKSLNDPIKLVNDAKNQTDKALDAYRKVAGTPEFRVSRLQPALRGLKHAVEALEREVARYKGT